MASAHPSDSTVQREAESEIVTALSDRIGMPLVAGGTLNLSRDVKISVDAKSEDGKVAVEAFARQGKLKGGQRQKIAKDVLKLALLRQEPAYAELRTIIAFASQEACDSVTGWVRRAADSFGVELRVVEIDSEMRERILTTQERQRMVNQPLQEFVDDLVAEHDA